MLNQELQLVGITEIGELTQPVGNALPEITTDVISATKELYRKVGYEPPWIGYLAFETDTCVGACGFKSPPRNGSVEIAYFTFPPHESRGVATKMAAALILIAKTASPDINVFAQTLPEENASTAILRKLGFHLARTVEHSEDGLIWEWHLDNQ